MPNNGFTHELPNNGITNNWITPQWIVEAFDPCYFDLDPCISETQPWNTARKGYSILQDGLKRPWFGNVWLNPPYGSETARWIQKLKQHGQGIALIFARTETRLWQDLIFPTADGYLFIKGRVGFSRPDGTLGKPATAPSALIAWGDENFFTLRELNDKGIIPGKILFDDRWSWRELEG